jgi:hypothetical protein
MTGKQKHHATGRTTVTAYVPTRFDEPPAGPALVEIQLTETFSGDVEGVGTARVIQEARKDGSASFVTIERVRGAIAGRKGTFLLQVSGTVRGKDMKAGWFVVPGSGTDELIGLRGDGGFTAEIGQNGNICLDYDFE